jgi:hypothetical protein
VIESVALDPGRAITLQVASATVAANIRVGCLPGIECRLAGAEDQAESIVRRSRFEVRGLAFSAFCFLPSQYGFSAVAVVRGRVVFLGDSITEGADGRSFRMTRRS